MTEPEPSKPHKPLFLARTGRHGTYKKLPPTSPTDLGRWVYVEPEDDTEDDLGYTSHAAKALPREPECIGPAILNSYAESNQFRYSQQHAADVLAARQMRPLLRAEDRLRDAERRAKHAKRRDLKGEFLALKGMLARYTRNDDEPKPGSSLLNRLEGVEAKLDGLEEAA